MSLIHFTSSSENSSLEFQAHQNWITRFSSSWSKDHGSMAAALDKAAVEPHAAHIAHKRKPNITLGGPRVKAVGSTESKYLKKC